MPPKDVLVFDAWTDYCYFRKPYSTTSILSFPFPPRTTVAGLIAAILGMERNDYHDRLFTQEKSRVSIQMLPSRANTSASDGAPKSLRMGLNFWNTKFGVTPIEISRRRGGLRFQALTEVYKDVRYRIYVWLAEKMDEFETRLRGRSPYYTPALGPAFAIANFAFVKRSPVEEEEAPGTRVSSIVPASPSYTISFTEGNKYGLVDGVPLYMNDRREVERFGSFYIEWSGHPIVLEKGRSWAMDDGTHIVLF